MRRDNLDDYESRVDALRGVSVGGIADPHLVQRRPVDRGPDFATAKVTTPANPNLRLHLERYVQGVDHLGRMVDRADAIAAQLGIMPEVLNGSRKDEGPISGLVDALLDVDRTAQIRLAALEDALDRIQRALG